MEALVKRYIHGDKSCFGEIGLEINGMLLALVIAAAIYFNMNAVCFGPAVESKKPTDSIHQDHSPSAT